MQPFMLADEAKLKHKGSCRTNACHVVYNLFIIVLCCTLVYKEHNKAQDHASSTGKFGKV